MGGLRPGTEGKPKLERPEARGVKGTGTGRIWGVKKGNGKTDKRKGGKGKGCWVSPLLFPKQISRQ